jgi:hypothetical protein
VLSQVLPAKASAAVFCPDTQGASRGLAIATETCEMLFLAKGAEEGSRQGAIRQLAGTVGARTAQVPSIHRIAFWLSFFYAGDQLLFHRFTRWLCRAWPLLYSRRWWIPVTSRSLPLLSPLCLCPSRWVLAVLCACEPRSQLDIIRHWLLLGMAQGLLRRALREHSFAQRSQWYVLTSYPQRLTLLSNHR